MWRVFVPLFGLVLIAHAQPSLSLHQTGMADLELSWPATDLGYTLEQTADLSPPAEWTPVNVVPVSQNGQFAASLKITEQLQFFRLSQAALTGIESTSPFDGETGVAVTRESIVRFSAPLETDPIFNDQNFYAIAAGRKILSRTEISRDRKQATLFYLEPLPGGAVVNVFLDPDDILDALGRALDPAAFPADHSILSFSTLSLTPLAQTAVTGTVYASELAGGQSKTNKPLAGVTITVDGMEQTLRVVTDATGSFKLSPVPPGRFFVHIDGRTVTNDAAGIRYPDKAYYPFVGKAWDAVAGREDNLAGGSGQIYLPLIVAGTLRPVSQITPTPISFPASVVASNPSLAGVTITVPANALFNDNGTRGGKVGIAPVAPDRLPGPLPPGLEPPIVITVQTDGALNFDQPAPVCFPNVVDPVLGTPLPAGSKQSLISFNHKKGVWEAVGTMTVSADGKLVCTDPGSGILQPGWHGVAPLPDDPPPPPCGDNPAPPPPNASPLPAGGRIVALSDIDACIQDCAKKRDALIEALQLAKFQTLRRCADSWAIQGLPCPVRDGIIASYDLDIKLARDAYDQCVKDCKTPKVPEPKKPKPPVCRAKPRPRSSRNPGLAHALAQQTSPAVVQQIQDISRQIDVIAAPFLETSPPWPQAVLQQIADLLARADALAGGDAAAYYHNYLLAAEIQADADGTLDEPDGNAPDYPVLFVAEILRPSGSFFIRGKTEPFGQYHIFTPRDGQLLSVRFYDPQTKSYAIVYPRLRPNPPWRLPSFELFPVDDTFHDSDHDGLPDVVELVYGTDPHNPDSDGDGLPDGTEVEQGSNPLDGFVAQTGIIATAKTPGSAVDVSVAEGRVLTAEGASGVSLLSTFNGENPVLLAHVETGGNVERVTLANSLGIAAQPDNGLSVVDFNNLASPQVLYTLAIGGAHALATDGSSAYVGTTGGWIYQVKIQSGYIFRQIYLTNAIRDLAVSEGYLYALIDDRLFTISAADSSLAVAGSAPSSFTGGPNRRLFVADHRAYAVHGKGYNTFDLSNPGEPILLNEATSTQFGWKHLVLNGSGLALAAVGPASTDDGPHDVSLYDVTVPTNSLFSITTFVTPGIAQAIAVWNGLAYVADGNAGLEVVNYLTYDSQNVAPKISLAGNFSGVAPELVERAEATVVAHATDDVQVRNVEFYVDDTLVHIDGSYPFEFHFAVPALKTTNNFFKLRARAVDTGGNFAWSEEIKITILPDSTPPEVTTIFPRSVAAGTQVLTVNFNEEIDPASLTSASLRLWAAGPDGLPGTADDVEMAGGIRSTNSDGKGVTLRFPTALSLGAYRLVVGTGFTDLRANHLGAQVVHDFKIVDAVYWVPPFGGDWSEGKNWSTGYVPGTNDDVLVSTPIPSKIAFSRGESSIRSLQGDALFVLSGGRLEISGSMQMDSFELRGGTLASAHLVPGRNEQSYRLYLGTLDAVTFDADAILENSQV